jgi:SpoVK/Ycf46/Vps4 family AAA+-type ATPase
MYGTSLQQILAELERLDLLLRIQVWRARQRRSASDELAAFYIPDAEADELLDKAMGTPIWASVPLPPELRETAQARLDQSSRDIARKTAESLSQGVPLRLVELAQTFDLTAFDVDVILVCLAPELDHGYERIYAYLHDDVTRRRPTVDLIVNLLCSDLDTKVAARTRFSYAAPLLRHHLVQLREDLDHRCASWLGNTVGLDPRVARFLLDDDGVDDRLQPYVRVVRPAASLDEVAFPETFRRQLSQLTEHARTARHAEAGAEPILYFQGPYGVGKRTAAAACCQALGRALLTVDGKRLAASTTDEFAVLACLVDREARLQGALIYWEDFDALLAEENRAYLAVLLRVLEGHPGPAFLSGLTTWEPADTLREATFVRLVFPFPGREERLGLWRAALAGDVTTSPGTELDLAGLAGKFRLSGGQIRDAAATARNLAYARAPAAPQITAADLHAACRLHSNRKLAELAVKITPHYTWDDIVLPDDQMAQLREIYNQVQHRALVYDAWGFGGKLAMGKGLSILFAGPPGTGKTMAADVLAHALGLDLYKIDLSAVVSKYIGETEKNLARIFAEATTSNAILFFDEADALFGRRTQVRDAHDRYANVEISYLLQKIEEYDGVVVLATNLRKNMDEAFARRLHVTVEFPVPGVADRRRIWEQIWPAATPRDPGVDLQFLARRVEVPGGSIRNIALAGAFLAAADGGAVTMAHLLRAARREYQKIGKVLTAGELDGPLRVRVDHIAAGSGRCRLGTAVQW